MSISSKASVILLGLSLAATFALPAFGQNTLIKTATGTAAKRPDLIQQKLETAKENLASRAAALKTRLQAFKDQKKAGLAERINTNLNAINQNQTKQMQKHLNTMTNILDRLAFKVNQAAGDIKDPAAARTAITSARTSIATASAAVSAQAQKDYTIQVTSEARIKADAKKQRDQLHADLLALKKMIVDERQRVANAIRVARSEKVEASRVKEGTASGK